MSYTSADRSRVHALVEDLQRLGRTTWLDQQITGGAPWWREIIQRIQGAEVFLFALSVDSLKSRPCMLELRYAEQLRLPIIPIQVGELENRRIPVAGLQIIDYRQRSADVVIALVSAITELAAEPRRTPDPLPTPPPVPFEYLYRLAGEINVEEIPRREQGRIITELRQELSGEDDEIARNDILSLLRQLRGRPEITELNAREIDGVLDGLEARSVPPAENGATRLPASDVWRRRGADGAADESPESPTVVFGREQPEEPPVQAGTVPENPVRAIQVTQEPGTPEPGPEEAPAEQAGATAVLETATGPPAEEGRAPDWMAGLVSAPRSDPPTPSAPAATPTPVAPATAAPAWAQPAAAEAGIPDTDSAVTEPGPTGQGTGAWWAGTAPEPARPAGAPAGAVIGPTMAPPGAAGEPSVAAQPAPAVPDARSGFSFSAAALGATGIPLLVLGPAGVANRGPSTAGVAGLLLVAAIVGLALSLAANSRHQPHARWAVALSVLGLVGSVTFIAIAGAFS